MSRWKKPLLCWISLPFLLLLLPASWAYAELTAEQEETIQKHMWENRSKYNKLIGTPIKELAKNEKLKKPLGKLGDTLSALEVLEKIRDNKDHEALVKVAEELEKKGLKKIFPGLSSFLGWAGWAKAGMELFKTYAWDPMLIGEQVDTYYAHRRQGMSPQEALSYVAVELTPLQDLVKKTLAAQYNTEMIFDREGRILKKWEQKYRETLIAVLEMETYRKYHEEIRREMQRQLEKELELLEQELLAAAEKPQLRWEGEVPADLRTLEVGMEVNTGLSYTLLNTPAGKPYLAKYGWSLRGPLQKKHHEEASYANWPQFIKVSFKITPEFEPGEYHLSFNAAVPEEDLFISSTVVRFKVSDLYLTAKNQLEAARGLLAQCKLKAASDILPKSTGERLAQKKEIPEIGQLYDQFLALEKEITALESSLYLYRDLKASLQNEVNECNFQKTDQLLQNLRQLVEKSPAACGLKEDYESLYQRVLYARASFVAAAERFWEGKVKQMQCRFEEAVQAYQEAIRLSGDLNCQEAQEITAKARELIAGAKDKAQSKKDLEKELAEVEKLIVARKYKEAEEKLIRISYNLGEFMDYACHSSLNSRQKDLWAKIHGQLAVKIIGKPEAGLGQGVDFISEVTLNGVKVSDPDAYSHLWETTDINKPWTQKSVKYTYQQPGLKTIRLTVTDPRGRTATAAATLKVAPALSVKINADKAQVMIKEEVHLTPEIAEEKEECPCTYEWTASHVNKVITDKTARFHPGHAGVHVVSLTVKNRFGQTAAASVKVTVLEPKLAVKISGPAEIGLGQNADFFCEITLDGAAVKDPDAYKYRWEATDVNAPWAGKSVRYPFKAPGQKTIRLTVTDPHGRTATAAVNLKVATALSFRIHADKGKVSEGEKVTFTAAVQNEKEQCPCSYQWTASNFDKTITDHTAWFKYPQPGTYAINLTVKNRFQQKASATYNLVVKSRQVERERLATAERERRQEEAERARRAEEERLAREKEKTRLAAEERARQERERARLAEDERIRREKEKARFAEEERIKREREKARLAEQERIRQEREKARRAAEERRKQEAARIKKAQEERKKREEEIRNLRNKIVEWQKALDCLLEGKRKYPKSDLTCHGNWTMRSRDTEIEHFRGLLKDAQARLNKLTSTAHR